jgi:phosphopantothenoylcysteine decarboxylase/phosphopantothenate--cysteine ligase
MARILITSGPTRQYLDPVRYLSNASSGRMGCALAAAAVAAGYEVIVVSGPVEVEYPPEIEVIRVVSTQEMLDAAQAAFPRCDGLIAVAAPCDYQPVEVSATKLKRTGESLEIKLIETPDIVGTLGREKGARWIVAFALETHDPRTNAVQKLRRKNCDWIVLNGPEAINQQATQVEILDPAGAVVASLAGDKRQVAVELLQAIASQWMPPR